MFSVNSKDLPCQLGFNLCALCPFSTKFHLSQFPLVALTSDIVTGVMTKIGLCFQNFTCAFCTTPMRSPPSLQAIPCKATPAAVSNPGIDLCPPTAGFGMLAFVHTLLLTENQENP